MNTTERMAVAAAKAATNIEQHISKAREITEKGKLITSIEIPGGRLFNDGMGLSDARAGELIAIVEAMDMSDIMSILAGVVNSEDLSPASMVTIAFLVGRKSVRK